MSSTFLGGGVVAVRVKGGGGAGGLTATIATAKIGPERGGNL